MKCNITLLLNRARAIASADAGAFLISPFVGRIYDWHKKSAGKDFTAGEDPGVCSVRDSYGYYESNGVETIVMGASLCNAARMGEGAAPIEARIERELANALATSTAASGAATICSAVSCPAPTFS